MTERVTRDPEILAAWPRRGVCWKVVEVTRGSKGPGLEPCYVTGCNYHNWGEWHQHITVKGMKHSIPGFHCLASPEAARRILCFGLVLSASAVVEFDYEGVIGVGHFEVNGEPLPVLLCDRIRPRSWVTLPGCEAAQPVEMAEAVARG